MKEEKEQSGHSSEHSHHSGHLGRSGHSEADNVERFKEIKVIDDADNRHSEKHEKTAKTSKNKEIKVKNSEKGSETAKQHISHTSQASAVLAQDIIDASDTHDVKADEASEESAGAEKNEQNEQIFTPSVSVLLVLAIIALIANQVLIGSVAGLANSLATHSASSSATLLASGEKDLSNVNVDALASTAHTIAAVFPVDEIKSSQDAMAIMFPTGTPEYGETLGVSFDDPVDSLSKLANMYNGLKSEVKNNNPEAFNRFVNLASNPKGVSCEYCCGVGPIGADKNGNSRCGCQHNPALLSVALYLSAYSDYSDAEILREVMKWKTLFFPKNMIELGISLGGGNAQTTLDNLPGMVGGC